MNKNYKHTVIAAVAFMLTVALLAGLGNAAQAAPDAPSAQTTWYCDPGTANRGIQFTLDNLASPGDIICLWPSPTATTSSVFFYENVVVNYTVTILGLNHGMVAFDPRNPESYVYPRAEGTEAVFTVLADNVTIDGVFVAASGTFGGLPVTAEHGIYVDSEDRATDYVSDIHLLNNFVESAGEGIELDGVGEYSDGNIIAGNYVLRYFAMPDTFIGIQAFDNMFATIENNKVKNYEDAIWIESFDMAGTIDVIDNVVENTNFDLCHGIYVYDLTGNYLVLNIDGNMVTAFMDDDADDESVGLGIYDVHGYNLVQITVSNNIITMVDVGMEFDALDIWSYSVILSGNVLSIIYDDAVIMTNDDGANDWVAFTVSNMLINDVEWDAFEIDTGDDGSRVYVTLLSGVVIIDVDIGFDIEGQGSWVTSPAAEYSNSMADVDTYYFDIDDNMKDIDATRIAINGELGREMDFQELFDVENMTWHAIDVNPNIEPIAFVMYDLDTAYVSQENQIQYAIEVYDHDGAWPVDHTLFADTIYVQWGDYDGTDGALQNDGVYIWRSVELIGVTSTYWSTLGHVPELYYDVVNDPQYMILIEDTTSVLVENFHLNGDGCESLFSDGIVVRTNDKPVSEITLHDLYITEFNGTGVKMWGYGVAFTGITIDNVDMDDLAMQGIYLQVNYDEFSMADEDILINSGILITNCFIEDTLESFDTEEDLGAPSDDGAWGAAIELWGITDSTISHNQILQTAEGYFNEDAWYFGLIVTGADVVVEYNVLNSYTADEPSNGIYLETDADGYYAYNVRFIAETPVFHYNQFWLYQSNEAPEVYALFYYEGDMAADVDGADIVDARYNFWWDNEYSGSAGNLGPYSDPDHMINPNEDGTGCQVEDFINFAPWYMDRNMDELTVDVFISADKNEDREYVDGDEVFYTIQSGVDAAENGDWVIVSAGEYFEQVEMTSNISLLGAYVVRYTFDMPQMWGADGNDYEIICIDAYEWDVSATVDNFQFVGATSYLIDVYGAYAVISNNVFEGSETGESEDGIYGQIAVFVRDSGSASIFLNDFYEIGGEEEQEFGAVSVDYRSSASIYENYFSGLYNETAIWAVGVIAPLTIVENHIDNFTFGVNIEALYGVTSSDIVIAGNLIHECLVGIAMDDVEDTLIEENTIIGEEETPSWYAYDYSFDIMINAAGNGVVVLNNNLLSEGNTDDTVGLWNAAGYEDVIADDNFWGKPSGPSGGFFAWHYDSLESYYGINDACATAWGGGTIVSDNVDYGTWLNNLFPVGLSIYANFDAPKIVDDDTWEDPIHSAITGIDIVDAEGSGEVVLGKYVGSPGTMFWGYNLGRYYEIAVWHESEDLDSLTVNIYFGDADLSEVKVDELRLFFWNMDLGCWFPCIASEVNVEGLYVQMTFDDESLPTIDMLREDMAFMIGAPKLIITPTEGKSGIIIEGYGSGFVPHQAISMYIGKSFLGAIPTEIKGVYFVDDAGNVTGIELILPYLNQGEYQITMTDPMWLAEYGDEYFASADYIVLGNQMYVQLDVGAIYFAGEIATWYGSANTDGLPYELTADMIMAYLIFDGEIMPVPAESIEMISDYDFMVTMPILGDAAAGQYTLKVFVFANDMYAGTIEEGFQISQTFEDMTYALISIEDGIMILSNKMDTLQLTVDEINATVLNIQGNVVTIKTTLGLVKTTVDRIDVNVIDVQGSLVTMEAALSDQMGVGFSTVRITLDDIEAKIDNIHGDIVTLSTTVGAIELTVADIDAQVTLINGNIVTLTTNVGIVQTTLESIEAKVDTINGNVATLQTSVGAIQVSIDDLDAKIVALDGKVVTISTNLNALTVTVDAIKLNVTAIDGRTVTMSSTLGSITGTLTAMTGSIATINTNLGQVKTDVGNIAGATTGINSTLAFIILAILIVVAIVLVFLRTKK